METRQPNTSPWILRPYDQRTVAVIVLLGIVLVAGYWLSAGGLSGQLVEIEHHAATPAEFRVDVNAADWPELAQLPGIGETLAERIIESRESIGPYQTHDDLERVSGIGPKKLAKMKPYLLPIQPSAPSADAAGAKSRSIEP